MAKVSVIVPVFGVEQYIERCAVSLFEQTLSDMEFVFVNDCTPDSSIAILKEVLSRYPDRKDQVKIIDHEANRGQAIAFRTGIENATGEYLIKCDSDDTIHRDMYRSMYETAARNNLDMVAADITLVYLPSKVYPEGNRVCMPCTFPGMDGISALLRNKVPSSVCNKMIRRTILEEDGFVFPEDSMCEDLVYSIQYEIKSREKEYLRESYYDYYRYPNSFTWNQDIDALRKKHLQVYENVSTVIGILEKAGLREKYKEEIIHQCLFVKSGLNRIIRCDGIYSIWKNTFKEVNMKIPFCRTIPVKERGLFILYYSHLDRLYHRLKHLFA